MDDHIHHFIDHVFLPLRLPQHDDSDTAKDPALVEALRDALRDFVGMAPNEHRLQWQPFVKMLSNMLAARHDHGGFSNGDLKNQLQQMSDGGMLFPRETRDLMWTEASNVPDLLALHIRSQNAGLIIRHCSKEYTFEAFELSPTNEAIMQTKGRLRRLFPGPAVAIDSIRISDDNFVEPLVEMIVKMDAETPDEIHSKAKKARSKVSETRDAVHPRFVTQMLSGILGAIGRSLNVQRIYKHTRDDVLWDNVLLPWRRSPLWLLLRVALQMSTSGEGTSHLNLRYKSFMLFFMAGLLKRGLQVSLPSDILFMMLAKISRRALKLGAVQREPWLTEVESTVKSARNILACRWAEIEDNPDPLGTKLLWYPSELSWTSDTSLDLGHLRIYLGNAFRRPEIPPSRSKFTPDRSFRVTECDLKIPRLDSCNGAGEREKRFRLAGFESWVEDNLQAWLGSNLEHSGCCEALAIAIREYTSVGSSVYESVPEDYSLMILTIMELWQAMDESAVHHHPLLRDYSIDMGAEVLRPLLLPRKAQMQRLSRVEDYLIAREESSSPNATWVFGLPNTPSSLAVRYFDQSPHHQRLRQDIEAHAEQQRSLKLKEMADKLRRQQDLMQESSSMDCQFDTSWWRQKQSVKHSGSCKKCHLKSTAQAITISIHEWPLPRAALEAKATTFELDVPAIIFHWRETLYGIIADLLQAKVKSASSRRNKGKISNHYPLKHYSGLHAFIKPHAGRLQLSSCTKSFTSSHYRAMKIDKADASNVCVNNGLNYEMFDCMTQGWTSKFSRNYDIRQQCTFELPNGPYQCLQFTLDNTVHTSNQIIATQSKCPDALTLHEFYSFGTLRCGHRLQWRNIVRELTTQVLNISCEETHVLFIQAVWQLGPADGSNICRESHVDLQEERFGNSLLIALNGVLATIGGNWQGAVAARTLTVLASRLLSLTLSSGIQKQCCQFLRKVREISQYWMRDLQCTLREESEGEEFNELRQRCLEVALTCQLSFDVDSCFFSNLLYTDEDITTAIECSIVIHDYVPAAISQLPKSLKSIVRRQWRLMYRLESFLRRKILQDSNGLDRAIERVWSSYKTGSEWTPLKAPDQQWLVTKTSDQGGPPCSVQINLLDGSLLVNGLPLTRLPHGYELHSTFQRLFGQKVFDVVPSTMHGMIFEVRNDVCGHRIHFRMCDSELIVRATKDGRAWEILPVDAIGEELPLHFCQDFAHWLDIGTSVIEFRPLTNLWLSNPQNWSMQTNGDGKYILAQGSRTLISPFSDTGKAVSAILSPLESERHIQIALDSNDQKLDVHLPRLKLEFFQSVGGFHLESKQFRGMVVDSDQSLGTFTGLVNKLVLRGEDERTRSVLVLDGKVAFERRGYHIVVHIQPHEKQVSYHHYQIDSQLGRLVDAGSLKSRLFRCYLHAVTAHCLTDRLTGHTGTEEALSILSSPSVRSFQRLSEAECEILKLISDLTPHHSFYPSHLRVMQTVHWQNLSPLSQHNSFVTLTKQILAIGISLDGLYDQTSPSVEPNDGEDLHLLSRAAIRDSTYRVHGFGAEDHTVNQDVAYNARDVSRDEREAYVYKISKLVDQWSTNLQGCARLMEEIESWRSRIRGYKPSMSPVGFEIGWLRPYDTFLPAIWCNLHIAMSHSVKERDQYRIMFFLSTLAYSQHANHRIVETLLAFATVPQLKLASPALEDWYDLSDGYAATTARIEALTKDNIRPFGTCPEANLPQLPSESWIDAEDRRENQYQSAVERRIRGFVDALLLQWPNENVTVPRDDEFDTYIFTTKATEAVRTCFQSWHRNEKFQKSVRRVQTVLNSLKGRVENGMLHIPPCPPYVPLHQQYHVSTDDLFHRKAPTFGPLHVSILRSQTRSRKCGSEDHLQLNNLLERLTCASPVGYEQGYASALAKSIASLQGRQEQSLDVSLEVIKPLIAEHLEVCETQFYDVHQKTIDFFRTETSTTRRIVSIAEMGPRISTMVLLRLLAGTNAANIPDCWRRVLIHYGLALSELQRARRLIRCGENRSELLNELMSLNHRNWDPNEYPGWLVFEIENDIAIRPVQGQVARELITPSSGKNSVLQLNMGEGKSSVIVPIAAWALADRTKLVRIVVLKPLSQQMLNLLIRKMSGLLGRRIYQMPTSRSLRLNVDQARQLRSLCEECMRTGGILLVQPEHLLSFELMGIEQWLTGDRQLGAVLIEAQKWLDENTRDILDESDEILSVRFELVYTMGSQRTIDLCPERWAIIQCVLQLISDCSEPILSHFPQGLEVHRYCQGSFPHLRVLQHSAGEELLRAVARKVCSVGLTGLPVWNLPSDMRAILFEYLIDPCIGTDRVDSLRNAVDATSWKSLLLLKGLLRDGVLSFALQQKRWRVNYGLDLSRTLLAVPYHAKDCPAARAEFSHPDATIVLTCLSYYYGGLSDQQLRTAFEKLLACDHAQEEFELWVKDARELPAHFHRLSGINLSDSAQCSGITFPCLRHAKTVIDFYLAEIVFPRDMKEFTHKLSSSGWNIAKEKTHPTTGFSGTNDSRYILPLSISQCDLPSQLPTNALVLKWILQPENSFRHVTKDSGKDTLDAHSLLEAVVNSSPPVRVILDVGAQVLEWKNEEVGRRWLLRTPVADAQAVVLFDDSGDLSVLSRDGTVESLTTSPYASQMDQCLVYLDEAHTRGTDLKLPADYRAAVTLGPALTKDRLIQACMRMRKLGRGQSVMFCAPIEVEHRILQVNAKTECDSIETIDVLRWSISETCTNMKKSVPLWAVQGLRCQRQCIAWSNVIRERSGVPCVEEATSMLGTEAQSLQDRYGSNQRTCEENILLNDAEDRSLSPRLNQVDAIREKCRAFHVGSFQTATLREEQERELSPEKEQEREIEQPPMVKPMIHTIHPDVESLIRTGKVDRTSQAFCPAFELFKDTSAEQHLERGKWPTDVLITSDFRRTVNAVGNQQLDFFLRPVHWIIRAANGGMVDLVVISPHEAQELLPYIRQQGRVSFHMYFAKVNASVRGPNDLSFCMIPDPCDRPMPPQGMMLLNLFAGQLYLPDYEAYLSFCKFLGLCTQPPPDDLRAASDGFLSPKSRSQIALTDGGSPFEMSPVPFLRMIFVLRRKGQVFRHSHIGKILSGNLLERNDF